MTVSTQFITSRVLHVLLTECRNLNDRIERRAVIPSLMTDFVKIGQVFHKLKEMAQNTQRLHVELTILSLCLRNGSRLKQWSWSFWNACLIVCVMVKKRVILSLNISSS